MPPKSFSVEDIVASFEAMLDEAESRSPEKPSHTPTDPDAIDLKISPQTLEFSSEKPEETPHYANHRKRLTDKFDRRGESAFDDYELLELVLFRTIPRIDTKPIAKTLIKTFGNLAEVVAAPSMKLIEVDGVGPATARDLKLLQQISVRIGQKSVLNRRVLSSWSALLDYCRAAMQFESREQFRALFLDKKNRLIADEVMSQGTIDRAPVYPREIVKRALHHEATAVILAHNHPSGDPTPSPQDIELTSRITEALTVIDVIVHDHLIIGREDVASFKMLGLL